MAIYPNVNELMGWGGKCALQCICANNVFNSHLRHTVLFATKGFDIELDFSGLGWIVQSIILKFGMDYYSCKQACTGNAVLTSEECGPAYGFGFEGIAVKFVSVDSDTFSSGSLVQAITDEWKNIFRGNPDSPDQQFSVGVAFGFGSGLWRSNDGPNFDQCAGKSFNPTDSVNCQPWNKGNKNLDVCCDETCPTDTSTDAPSSSPTSGPSKSPTTSPSKAVSFARDEFVRSYPKLTHLDNVTSFSDAICSPHPAHRNHPRPAPRLAPLCRHLWNYTA